MTKLIWERKRNITKSLRVSLKTQKIRNHALKFLHIYSIQTQINTIPYIEINNILAETNTGIAEVLNNYFTEHSTVDDSNAPLLYYVIPNNTTLGSVYISDQDVKDSISLLKINKALVLIS